MTTMYTHVIHLADIHIRAGNEDCARYNEYRVVFQNLKNELHKLECVQNETALIVVCGDIFHNKNKLEPHAIRLWNKFMRSLTQIGTVAIICGNHDFRQEAPNTPDLIDVLHQSWGKSKYECHYLKETGLYTFDNIEIGVVCIKSTLDSLSTAGTVDELPEFPQPQCDDKVHVALFHGTITQSALPNGQLMAAGKGYPLEWFKGYDIVMLGDNHKQQVNVSSWGMPWGYPGSLVQQDIGEPVVGHGFILWDLETRKGTPHHIHNDFGRMKARYKDNSVQVRLDHRRFVSLEDVAGTTWFPKTPAVAIVGNIGDEVPIRKHFSEFGIIPSSMKTTSMIAKDAIEDESDTTVDVLMTEISNLNNPKRWMEYISANDAELGNTVESMRWMEKPELMMMEMVPEEISPDLATAVKKVRGKIQEACDVHCNAELKEHEAAQSKVTLKHMEWSWTFSYGEINWFNFETMEGNIAILNGPNASGKSAFIDTLCIGLFGEPNPNRIMNSSKKMSGHFIHNQRPPGTASSSMYVKLIVDVNGTLYEILRKYAVQDKTETKILSVELSVVEPDYSTKTLQCSGTTLVNAWVTKHCGTIESLMKTSIVSQLDNNNFFYAKPDEQKKIIDHAVNLSALQSFGNIVHEALLGYNSLIKTLSTIINTSHAASEQDGQIVSDDEIKECEEEVKTLRERIAALEKERDVLAGLCGPYITGDVPPELNTIEKAMEAQRHIKSEIDKLRSEGGVELENKNDYIVRFSLLNKQIEELGGCDDLSNDVDASVLQGNIKKMEKKLLKLHSSKPQGSRSNEAVISDVEELDKWLSEHKEWVDDIEGTRMQLSKSKEKIAKLEVAFQEWASYGVEPCEGTEATDDACDEDWKSTIVRYNAIKTKVAQKNEEIVEHRLSSIVPIRHKNDEMKWMDELAHYETAKASCDENGWTDAKECKDNMQQTRAYIAKRMELTTQITSTKAMLERCQDELQSEPEWQHKFNQWKEEALSYDGKEDTTENDVNIAELRGLLEIQRELTKTLADVQNRKDAFESEQGEWNAEWDRWCMKVTRAKKHKWTSSHAIEQHLDELEECIMNFKVLSKEKLELEEECSQLAGHPYNPACAACRANPLHVRHDKKRKRIEVVNAELQQYGSLENLEKQKVYLRKGLECIQYIEANKASIEKKQKARREEENSIASHLEETKAKLESLPDADDIQSMISKATEERDALVTFLSNKGDMSAKYARLEKLSQEEQQLSASIAKLQKTLNKMQDDDELQNTLAYWETAAETCTYVTLHSKHILTEMEAWEQSRNEWREVEIWENILETLVAENVELQNQLVTCHAAAHASWSNAGERLKTQLDDARESYAQLERFLAEVEHKLSLNRTLTMELNLCKAYETWKEDVGKIESEISNAQCLLYCIERAEIEKTLESLEMLDSLNKRLKEAECAVALHEYKTHKDTSCSLHSRLFSLTSVIEQAGRDAKRNAMKTKAQSQLHQLWMKWTAARDVLMKLDERLVGERGKGNGSTAIVGGDTFKEWVYANHVIPLLEKQVNRFLMDVDHIRLRIEYKSKSLQYFVSDRGNETSFAASSGYQQFVIGLAMRQALAVIGGSGNNLQHMFIDEGFTACDATNIEKAHDVLKLLIDMGKYKSILLVTHLESLKDVIPMKINISRTDAFSKLRYGEKYPVFQNSTRSRGRPKKQTVTL